jgi:transposase-like protein
MGRRGPGFYRGVLTEERLRSDLQTGKTVASIAAEVGCAPQTVRVYLSLYGLPAGTPSAGDADLIEKYGRLGTVRAVAEELGVGFETARRRLVAAGARLHGVGGFRPTPKADGEMTDSLVTRYQGGESLAQLAAEFGVGANTVRRRLLAAGVEPRPAHRRRSELEPRTSD